MLDFEANDLSLRDNCRREISINIVFSDTNVIFSLVNFEQLEAIASRAVVLYLYVDL